MLVITIIKLICLVSLCVYSSLTDIKKGIVQNKIILISIGFGIAFNSIEWICFDSTDILKQLSNILIVDLIAIMLYVLHIWAGGDCKLIFAISLLVPYNMFVPKLNDWVSLPLMLGITFAASYIYLLIDSIIMALKKKNSFDKKQLIGKITNAIARWISCISYITLMDIFILHFYVGIPKAFLFVTNICLILIVSGISILRNKYVVTAITIFSLVLKLLFHQSLIDKFVLINYILAILFIALRMFIDEYNYDIIQTSQVKKGMILSAATTIQFVNSRVKGLPTQSTEDLRSRITENEALAIQKWEKSKYGTPTIQIVRKLPFAIFISIGTICYIVLGAIIKW